MHGGRGRGCCNRHRLRRDRRRSHGRRDGLSRRRCSDRARMRNDQLLPRRQRARALVAIGRKDLSRAHPVALGQDLERIAGPDDDLGASRRTRRGNRARRHGPRGLELRLRRRRIGMGRLGVSRLRRCRRDRRRRHIGRNAAPAARHASRPAAGWIGLRRGDRRRRQRRGRISGGRRRCGRVLLSDRLMLPRGRLHRTGGVGGEGIRKGILRLRQPRRHIGAAAGNAE